VRGIRAALTHDTYSARRAALSNNAQIITMGARVIGIELAKTIADAYLDVAFDFDPNGPSGGNVVAIDGVDAKYASNNGPNAAPSLPGEEDPGREERLQEVTTK